MVFLGSPGEFDASTDPEARAFLGVLHAE
jgi:hypothetical protein